MSTFDHPELCTLGEAECIKEVMVGEQKLISFSGVKAGAACTVVLRGARYVARYLLFLLMHNKLAP